MIMLKESIKFIWYDKPKMFGILFGIILSVFLVGQQIGICFSLLDSAISLAKFNQQYIWVVSDKSQQVGDLPLIDQRIGRALKSISGITAVHQLVLGVGEAKFPNGTKASLVLIGSAGPDFAGGPWKIIPGEERVLLQENTLMTDGNDAIIQANLELNSPFEVNGNRVVNAGFTQGARGLGQSYAFGSVELIRRLAGIPRTKTSAFLIEISPDANPQQVIQSIHQEIPGIKARSGKDFADESLSYFATTSGIVASFGLLVVFAIITGFAIVGLTLFSAVNDRIKDYGTLKAIGATNGTIRKIILGQCLIYALVSFCLAVFLLLGFVSATKESLDIQVTSALLFFLIGITVFIAGAGGLLAMRKIIRLEPAAIFRS